MYKNVTSQHSLDCSSKFKKILRDPAIVKLSDVVNTTDFYYLQRFTSLKLGLDMQWIEL